MISFFPSRQIALELGPLEIHWYGVMYAISFLVGLYLLPRMVSLARLEVNTRDREAIFLAAFLGVILGGRLGFVVFYGGSYFVSHPLEVFAVWKGGMSSHGGFVGVILALAFVAWRKHIDIFRLGDAVVVPVAIGLALGRFGNFINGELYGVATSMPWGMYFPGAEGLRHPTQIYAVLKDLCIALVCFVHLQRIMAVRPGQTAAIFLILYSILRFIVEIYREQPYGFVAVLGYQLSRGQLLTIPILTAGLVMYFYVRRKTS